MRSTKKYFSLIELLVVITVIAILTSLLVPVINFGRENARKAACVNNQAQIIQIVLSYASENNKDLTDVVGNWRQWYAKLIIANGGSYDRTKISNYYSFGYVDDDKNDLLDDAFSVGTKKLFRCPADFTKGTTSYARNDPTGGWTLQKNKYDPRLVNSRLSVIRRPSNLILIAERWSDKHIQGSGKENSRDQETANSFHLRTWREGMTGDNSADNYTSRHRGTAPVGYIDGHVVVGPFLNTVQGKDIKNIKGWWETANGHWSDDPTLK